MTEQVSLHSAVVDAEGCLVAGSSAVIVPWWSFTKTLIAVCALRLHKDGCIDLDAPVDGYPFTLRMLLAHRAGLADYGGRPAYRAAVAAGGEPWSDAELFAQVPPDRLLFAPETGWAYSNVGYLIARRALEAAYGAGLADMLQQLVFKPLDIGQSRLAETRDHMRKTVFPAEHRNHPGWAFHGIVVGPVSDAAATLHRLLRGPSLGEDCRAALLSSHPVGGPIPGRPWQGPAYGLGIMMGTMQGADMPQPLAVAGHSAGGFASAGAVYHRMEGPARTAAVFVDILNEAPAEHAALEKLVAV